MKIIVVILILLLSGCSEDDKIVDNDIKETPSVCKELSYIDDEENIYCDYDISKYYEYDDSWTNNLIELKEFDHQELLNIFNKDMSEVVIKRQACEIESENKTEGYAGAWVYCDEYNDNFTTYDYQMALDSLYDEMDFNVNDEGYLSGVGINYKDTKFYNNNLDNIIPSEYNLSSLITSDNNHRYTIKTINKEGIKGELSIGVINKEGHKISYIEYVKLLDNKEYYEVYRYN